VTFHHTFILSRFEPKYQHLASNPSRNIHHEAALRTTVRHGLINRILLFISDEKLQRALQNDSNQSEIKWNSILQTLNICLQRSSANAKKNSIAPTTVKQVWFVSSYMKYDTWSHDTIALNIIKYNQCKSKPMEDSIFVDF